MNRDSATVKLVEVQLDKPFRDVLRELYAEKGLSIEKIAEFLRGKDVPISAFTVRKYLYEYGIEVRHFPTVATPEANTANPKEAGAGGR